MVSAPSSLSSLATSKRSWRPLREENPITGFFSSKKIVQGFFKDGLVILPGDSNNDTIIRCVILDNSSGHLRPKKPVALIFEITGENGQFLAGAGCFMELSHCLILLWISNFIRKRYSICHSGLDPWFDRPFDRLMVLSNVEGLTTLSEVEGESSMLDRS